MRHQNEVPMNSEPYKPNQESFISTTNQMKLVFPRQFCYGHKYMPYIYQTKATQRWKEEYPKNFMWVYEENKGVAGENECRFRFWQFEREFGH